LARISDLVRMPTLKKYLGVGEVERLDVYELTAEEGGGFQVRVQFSDSVGGQQNRWLTTYRNENRIRTFRSLNTVWALLKPLGAKEIHVYDTSFISEVPETDPEPQL